MIPPEIRVTTLVRAPRERAYAAVTRAEELDAWFTTGAEVDPRLGDEMVWRWVDWGPDAYTGDDHGPVLEARRPERCVFRWQAALGGTTVEVDFEAHADDTLVRLRRARLPGHACGVGATHELCDRLGRGADTPQVLGRARSALLSGRDGS